MGETRLSVLSDDRKEATLSAWLRTFVLRPVQACRA